MMSSLARPRGREARRVRRTAKLFDKHHRSWYRRVDLRSLDLFRWQYCILGQTFRLRFGERLEHVPGAMVRRIILGGHLHALGLLGDARSVRLAAAWRYEIGVRRRTDRMRDALATINAEMAGGTSTDFDVTLTR